MTRQEAINDITEALGESFIDHEEAIEILRAEPKPDDGGWKEKHDKLLNRYREKFTEDPFQPNTVQPTAGFSGAIEEEEKVVPTFSNLRIMNTGINE